MKYGRYQIVNELGRGSMGVVYKAHDPQIDRTIALKILREDRVTSDDFVKRFLKEAMAVGRLSHPGIVTVYDVGQDHGTIYIAMEFLEGTPLDEIQESRKFSHQEIIDIGIQTAQALLYAHQNGIIHRDIKPPNIIYSPDGSIRVTDFGIARIEDPNGHQLTQAGEILGTPLYMSPEQVMGQPLDGRSDLYSLGVILYLLTTGKRPFQESNLAAIFRAITTDTPEAPHVLDPEVPKGLSTLIMSLLDKEPSGRYDSGKELLEAFRTCLADEQSLATPSLSASSPPSPESELPPASKLDVAQKRKGNKVKLLSGGLLGLCICLGLVGYYLLRPLPPNKSIQNGNEILPVDGTTTNIETAAGVVDNRNSVASITPSVTIENDTKNNIAGNGLAVQQNPGAKNSVASNGGTRIIADPPVEIEAIDPSELINQATALSVTITDLPKKQLVLESAMELLKISPRYQQDMEMAEKMYNGAVETQNKKLEFYLQEINNLHAKFSPEQIDNSMDLAVTDSRSARQKKVITLLNVHLKSLQNGAKLTPAKVLEDFSQGFNSFVD